MTIYPETKEGDLRLRPYSKVLYLSPMLERAALDIGVAVIAHELAHIALKHNVFPGTEDETQEKAAWVLIDEWGFSREARKRAASMKRRESRETG